MNVERIAKIARSYQAKTTAPLGFAFKDMETGAKYCLNGDKEFQSASVFKIFVLIELFRMVQRGELSLEQKIPLLKEDFSSGSGLLKYLTPGDVLTLHDYSYLMMAFSDNTATDIVLKYVTLEKIKDDILSPFQFKHTKVDFNCKNLLSIAYAVTSSDTDLNGEEDRCYHSTPFYKCEVPKNNSITPKDQLRCLDMLYHGEFGAPETTESMLDIMKRCALNQRIPKYLPPDTQVAHKTGSIDRVCNDVGLVYTDKGVYAIVLFYGGNRANKEEYHKNIKHCIGEPLLARLSRDVFDVYTKTKD